MEHRIPSLLTHIKIGFNVLGTLSEQKLFRFYLPHFTCKNTNPFFTDFLKPPVIILTHDGANPLGIARSLGRHKVPVYVLTPNQNTSMAWSRYVKKVFILVSEKDKKEIRERLEDFLREIDQQLGKPILMVTNESHYLDLEPLKDFLNEHFSLLTPLDKVLPLAVKNNQFPLAAQAGFRVMETAILRNAEDLNLLENKLSFPVIVRPQSNNLRGKFEEKVVLYKDIETLRGHLTPLLTGDTELIAQEYVPGTDRDIVFFMASCDETGEPRLWLSGRKVRQNPPEMGVMASGQVDSVPDPDFVEKSKRLCRLFELRGFIGIECKQHVVTKEYVYIESSFRPEAFNAMCLAANVDLVWDSYLFALNKPCGTVCPEFPKGSWACAEFEHGTMKILKRQGDPDWWKVLLPLPRPIAYAFFTWDDPMPFVMQTLHILCRRLKLLFCKT